MAMFTMHIAMILAVFAAAAGLVALHYAAQHKAKLIKVAGVMLVVIGIGSAACTWYFAAKYFFMGHYEHAYDFNITMEGKGPHYHCSSSVGD